METIDCLQKAIDFIEDNILDDPGYDVIASQAYMASFHFQRVFAAICNVSLGEYIRNRRLYLAGMELQNSSVKVIDVAYRYGYESPESFTRAFTKLHGITPSAIRNSLNTLTPYPKIQIRSYIGGSSMLQGFKERGYNVSENAPIYYTRNMDKTAKWFEDVLGWYAGIDARNEDGDGTYGCILPIPGEIKSMTLTPFNGFHMFFGEPSKQTVGFTRVDNIEKLHEYVIKKGWTKISDITVQPWGARECSITTIDGGTMRFFQVD